MSATALGQDIVDVILHEWFTCTTLLIPRITVTSMCHAQNANTISSFAVTKSNSVVVTVRVEAFGSGALIVPQFNVDINQTRLKVLFACVRRCLSATWDERNMRRKNNVNGFTLVCGEKDVSTMDGISECLVSNVFDLEHHRVIYLVVPTTRGLLKDMYIANRGPQWEAAYEWNEEGNRLNDWYGVGADKSDNVTLIDLPQNRLQGLAHPSQSRMHVSITLSTFTCCTA